MDSDKLWLKMKLLRQIYEKQEFKKTRFFEFLIFRSLKEFTAATLDSYSAKRVKNQNLRFIFCQICNQHYTCILHSLSKAKYNRLNIL